MTNRRKRVYEIALIVCCLIIIGLTAYMGITAVQKSMRLNVGFPVSPTIKCQIDIKANGADDNTYTTIFNNNGEAIIGTGIELSGNMLKFTDTFANAYATTLGGSFVLKITNLMTDSGIKVSASGTGATSSPTYLAIKKSGSGADTGTMVVSGNSALSTLQLSFSEYNIYNISFSGAATNTDSEIVTGENFSTTITVNAGYDLPSSVTVTVGGVETANYTYNSITGILTINASAITGDIVVSAVFNPKSYTVTFNGNGGSAGTSITKAYGSSLGTLPTSTRTGYTFNGWYTATSDGTKISTTTTMPLNGATYFAQWTPITYTVNYNANGGSGTMSNSTHTYDVAKNLTANSFTKDEHVFNGWNTDPSGTGTKYNDSQSVTNLKSTQGASITLYAQWELKIYTLTYTVTNTELASRTAIIVTNDTSFSVIYGNDTTSFKSSDVDATTFDFSSGYNITPVTNAHKGKNNYFYKEKYHSLTVDGTSSGNASFTVPAGCKIFIFWIYASGQNMGISYFKLTPTINQSISVYYKTDSNQDTTTTNPIEQETARVFEFYMPSCDLRVDTETWSSSQHSGGDN